MLLTLTDTSFKFVHVNGRSLHTVDRWMGVEEGGNVLHSVIGEGKLSGWDWELSRGIYVRGNRPMSRGNVRFQAKITSSLCGSFHSIFTAFTLYCHLPRISYSVKHRPKSHPFELPRCSYDLSCKSFVLRCLYEFK